MARLNNPIMFSGTINNVCFYVMHGKTYLRTKSSLSRDRVLESKEFVKTRKCANKFAIAARLASPVYKALPENVRARWIYRSIAGEAASLLYKGKSEQEVNALLWNKYIGDTKVDNKGTAKPDSKKISFTRRSNRSLKQIFSRRWEEQGKNKKDFKKAWENPRSHEPNPLSRLIDPFGIFNFYSAP
jgi:hypothetical protein